MLKLHREQRLESEGVPRTRRVARARPGARLAPGLVVGGLLAALAAFSLTILWPGDGADPVGSPGAGAGTGALFTTGGEIGAGTLLVQTRLGIEVLEPGTAEARSLGEGVAFDLSSDGSLVLAGIEAATPSRSLVTELFTLDVATGARLGSLDAPEGTGFSMPALSPDGSRIAYVSVQPGQAADAPAAVCVVDVGLTDPTCHPTSGDVSAISWSPSGELMVGLLDAGRSIVRLDPRAGTSHDVLSLPGTPSVRAGLERAAMGEALAFDLPAAAPGGSIVAIETQTDEGGLILLTDLAGELVGMSGAGLPDWLTWEWSPAEDVLAYSVGRGPKGTGEEAWELRILDGTRDRLVTSSSGRALFQDLRWSPDGTTALLLWSDGAAQYLALVDMTTGSIAWEEQVDLGVREALVDWEGSGT